MKTRVLAFILLGALTVHAQTAVPAAPTTRAAPASRPAERFVVADDGRKYPLNPDFIAKTTPSGILSLTAGAIPRYTQTGPLPEPVPARHGVIAPFPHNPNLPTLWTIGDSTVRTGVNGTGEDQPGQWGWGCPLVGYFDTTKVNVVNRAVGGTTSGSFYSTLWKPLVALIKPGDVVIMQFGTNSGGVELRGTGPETRPVAGRGRGAQASVGHTYGWFIRQIIDETRAKGATPVVCSLIPRNNRGPNGKITRSAATQAGWAKEVAAAENAGFIDLNELVARKYDTMDKPTVDALFSGSPHTSWTGAVVNAETVISGLKALKPDPVAAYYVDQVKEIPAAPDLSGIAPPVQPSSSPAN